MVDGALVEGPVNGAVVVGTLFDPPVARPSSGELLVGAGRGVPSDDVTPTEGYPVSEHVASEMFVSAIVSYMIPAAPCQL